jgi:hypothetical protein
MQGNYIFDMESASLLAYTGASSLIPEFFANYLQMPHDKMPALS